MKPDQERVRNLLTDTVTLLCKNGLQYQTELRVQGVLGITLDNNEVFIVHINEKFGDAIGGALTIRNDEGDAAKTLLGSTRHDARKSHDASRGDTPVVVNSKTGEVVHRRRRRSRESSASPALPTNSSQQQILQRPIKRLMPSNNASPSAVRNRSTLQNSMGGGPAVPDNDDVIEVKVKTEEDDVILVEQRHNDKAEIGGAAPQDIPHTTDQSAMHESYPNLSLSELQGSYQPFGEILGVTDSSTNSGAEGMAPPATKRRATSGNTQDSFGGSSEMGPTPDAGGPFITGIIRNEIMTGDVAPQTTTATSWDPPQIPEFGTLTSQDRQMILDSTPGCSSWDTSQQSQVSAATTATPLTLPNMSDQSSESVIPDGPAIRFQTGPGFKSGNFTIKLTQGLPSVDEPNENAYVQAHEQSNPTIFKCDVCEKQFKGKSQLWYHLRTKHLGRRFVCPECQCTFASSGGLTQHVKHIHLKLSRYKCEHCGKGYSDRSNYYDHLATHTGARRNVCSICQKQFTFKPGLKAHMLHFHPNESAHM